MKKKAIIISLSGTKLTKKEIILLKKKPWGVILFSRNIKSINQTQKLVDYLDNGWCYGCRFPDSDD